MKKEDVIRQNMFKWLIASVLASVRLVGNRQMKVFTRGMSLVFVNMLNRENSEPLQESGDATKVVQDYRNLEVASGQCGENEVQLTQKDKTLEIVVNNCMYGGMCQVLLPTLTGTGEFTETTIPCFRCSNYSAALALYNRTRWPYRLVQYAPGAKCTGVLEQR